MDFVVCHSDGSAEKSFMLPSLKMGSMARAKHTIPKPPTHWVKLRQNRIPCDWASILSIMVAPVVVNPDMVSKNAFVILFTLPLK